MATIDIIKQLLQEVLQLENALADAEPDMELLGNIPEFDSMAVVSVITAMEERFEIIIEDDDIDADIFETIGSLSDFIDSKLANSY